MRAGCWLQPLTLSLPVPACLSWPASSSPATSQSPLENTVGLRGQALHVSTHSHIRWGRSSVALRGPGTLGLLQGKVGIPEPQRYHPRQSLDLRMRGTPSQRPLGLEEPWNGQRTPRMGRGPASRATQLHPEPAPQGWLLPELLLLPKTPGQRSQRALLPWGPLLETGLLCLGHSVSGWDWNPGLPARLTRP